jgi:hypothetical protein
MGHGLRRTDSRGRASFVLRPQANCIAKRELPRDKRVRSREERLHLTNDQDDVGKSLTEDRRKHAKHFVLVATLGV